MHAGDDPHSDSEEPRLSFTGGIAMSGKCPVEYNRDPDDRKLLTAKRGLLPVSLVLTSECVLQQTSEAQIDQEQGLVILFVPLLRVS